MTRAEAISRIEEVRTSKNPVVQYYPMVKFKDGVNSVWVYLLRKGDEYSEYSGLVNMGYDSFDGNDDRRFKVFTKNDKNYRGITIEKCLDNLKVLGFIED